MGAPVVEGQILAGKYRVERIIGRGGMGVVVAATNLRLKKLVAVKLLAGTPTREVVKRFLREAKMAARLKSKHVARVLDAGPLETGGPYMVLEYLEGEDLSKILRRGPLAVSEAVDYVLQASEAIAEAHHVGIVHRDLKPANLFVAKAEDGTKSIKVLDFGISKLLAPSASDSQTALTHTDQMLGTPRYMAPEQMKSSRQVDARADIWAMGVILYQLVTARLPFEAWTLPELLVMMITDTRPPPPRSHRPDVPELLEAAILRCLEKDRDRRFASMGELAEAIAPFGSRETDRTVAEIRRLLEQPSGAAAPSSRSSVDWTPPSSPSSADLGPPSSRSSVDWTPPSSHTRASGHAPLSESGSPRPPPPSWVGATSEGNESANEASVSGITLKTGAPRTCTTLDAGPPPQRRSAGGAIAAAVSGLFAWFKGSGSAPDEHDPE